MLLTPFPVIIGRMKRKRPAYGVQRIVSGGQTGVDRAALDAAIQLGIPHGGWCPKGRRAEDGPIPDRYLLSEDDSPRYAARTERNVIDSDATLILHRGPLAGGTRLTARQARNHGRPLKTIDLGEEVSLASARAWLRRHEVAVLNVAGPRESQQPGITEQALALLTKLFSNLSRSKHSVR